MSMSDSVSVLWVIGFGSFTLASLVVGARLLALAARTRALAEAAFGTSLFLGGAGFVLLVLASRVIAAESAPRSVCGRQPRAAHRIDGARLRHLARVPARRALAGCIGRRDRSGARSVVRDPRWSTCG